MLTPRPLRRTTANAPKHNAARSASEFPNRVPAPSPSQSITAIPASATPIATHTPRATVSPSTIRPRSAAKKGAPLSRNMVFATVVWVMERMKRVLTAAINTLPSTIQGRKSRRAATSRPPLCTTKTTASAPARNQER